MATRRLIVNADDFGLSPETNRGIVTAHESGIVTSTSLMVCQPAAPAAAEYARRHPTLGIGLHLDFGEWAYRSGEWAPLYQVVSTDDAQAVRAETGRQLQIFRDLLGRGPTHLDSHQHAHRTPPVQGIVVTLGKQLGVPVRHFTPAVRYCGDFYGQDAASNSYPELVSAPALVRLIARLAAGVTELCCHPGFDLDLDTMYVHERTAEVYALCDPEVRNAIHASGIELASFPCVGREGGHS